MCEYWLSVRFFFDTFHLSSTVQYACVFSSYSCPRSDDIGFRKSWSGFLERRRRWRRRSWEEKRLLRAASHQSCRVFTPASVRSSQWASHPQLLSFERPWWCKSSRTRRHQCLSKVGHNTEKKKKIILYCPCLLRFETKVMHCLYVLFFFFAVQYRFSAFSTTTPLLSAACWICTPRVRTRSGFSGRISCNRSKTSSFGTQTVAATSPRLWAMSVSSSVLKKARKLLNFWLCFTTAIITHPLPLLFFVFFAHFSYARCSVYADQDGAEPSGNSVSAGNLVRLAVLVDRIEYQDKAGRLLRLFSERLAKVPISLPEMLSALVLYNDSPSEVPNVLIIWKRSLSDDDDDDGLKKPTRGQVFFYSSIDEIIVFFLLHPWPSRSFYCFLSVHCTQPSRLPNESHIHSKGADDGKGEMMILFFSCSLSLSLF